MEKVMVVLEVPVLRQSYEMLLPQYVSIEMLLVLIVEAVCSVSGQIYQDSGQEFLCSKRHGRILDDRMTLQEYGIQNGEHLLLI